MPSRTKASRGTSSTGQNQAWTRSEPPGPQQLPPAVTLEDPAVRPPEQVAQPRRSDSRRFLRNWRVRSRLLLLIVIPTASAVVLGSLSIASSVGKALAFQRVETLATLGQHIVTLAQRLEDERDQVAVFISMSAAAGGRDALLGPKPATADAQLSVVEAEIGATNRAAAQVRTEARAIGPSYSPQARQTAQVALTALSGLRYLRRAATGTKLPVLVVVHEYAQIINDVLALDNQIAQSASDPALAQAVQVLSLVSAMQEAASEQRAVLASALLQGGLTPAEVTALQTAQSAQQSNLQSFYLAASVGQQQDWNNSVNESFVYLANSEELQAIAIQESTGSLRSDPITAFDWYGAMSNSVDIQMGSVARKLTSEIITRAQQLRKSAITGAVITGAGVLLVLLLALMLTMVVGRSMVRPLRRLRAGALDVAGIRLPQTVRRMSEAGGEETAIEVEPIDVNSFDEIGEVARAFDQVHREALRLASNEAALRGNVNAMFVNLSRRSQSLVERQIKLIDDLEQGEQDSERLGSLFQMDHLATRMRRNSENLLVLAGQDSSRRWNQPVPLVDVLRAAISEIEQYERVMLNVQPGISVRGPAVNDVVHLIAELAENATSFSSADTPVSVSGHLLSSGGVLLDITDQGVGMGAEEMAHANWRLDNPPVVDVAVSRRMGLFVVARLAARHGIRVRLRPAGGNGLTALVWLPDEVVVKESPGARPSGPMRIAEGSARFAIGAGAPEYGGARSHDSGPLGPLDPASLGALDPGLAGVTPEGSVPVGTADFSPPGTFGAQGGDFGVIPERPSQFAARQENGVPPLGPQRIPGAGPHPGSYGSPSTGPLPPVGEETPGADMGEQAGAQAAAAADAAAEVAGGQSAAGAMPPVGAAGWPADHPSLPSSGSWSVPSEPSSPDAARSDSSGFALGAPVAGTRSSSGTFRSQDAHSATTSGDVIVPPAAALGEENRLPIFEAVESDWFRRGRPSVTLAAGRQPTQPRSEPVAAGWSSPGDEGWRAAEAAAAPTSAGLTRAGLPRRVPQANLVPGAAAGVAAGTVTETTVPATGPQRSAAATRDRFASFQRGMREGRAATGTDEADGTGDDVPGDG